MIKKLDRSYFDENSPVYEALDTNRSGEWEFNKIRGYGVVVISYMEHTFAIPLRSNIRHDASFITVRDNSSSMSKGKGLDFSKSLLIRSDRYISDETYRIPKNEHVKLIEKEYYIKEKFEKYVLRYVEAVTKRDQHILNSKEYRYTTLINYHNDLGLK